MSELNTLLWGLVESVQEDMLVDVWRACWTSGAVRWWEWSCCCQDCGCTHTLTVPQCRPFPASRSTNAVCPMTAVWLLPCGLYGWRQQVHFVAEKWAGPGKEGVAWFQWKSWGFFVWLFVFIFFKSRLPNLIFFRPCHWPMLLSSLRAWASCSFSEWIIKWISHRDSPGYTQELPSTGTYNGESSEFWSLQRNGTGEYAVTNKQRDWRAARPLFLRSAPSNGSRF